MEAEGEVRYKEPRIERDRVGQSRFRDFSGVSRLSISSIAPSKIDMSSFCFRRPLLGLDNKVVCASGSGSQC